MEKRIKLITKDDAVVSLALSDENMKKITKDMVHYSMYAQIIGEIYQCEYARAGVEIKYQTSFEGNIYLFYRGHLSSTLMIEAYYDKGKSVFDFWSDNKIYRAGNIAGLETADIIINQIQCFDIGDLT